MTDITEVKASIVVPSFQGAGRLPRLLDALIIQRIEVGINCEVVVVLDGVADNSENVLHGYRDKLPLRVIVLPDNRGRAAALNAGFEAAHGEILIRCDDDLTPEPNFASRHIFQHAGKEVGVVGLCPNRVTGTRYDTVYGSDSNSRALAAGYSLSPALRWSLWAANCSVTRTVYERVGPYDENFREYGWEDIDWGYRLHTVGVPILLDKELEALHRGVPTTVYQRINKSYSSGRARGMFQAKHHIRPEATEDERRWVDQIWSGGVALVARIGDQEKFAWAGRAIDAVLPFVPAKAGKRLVALGVESAGLSGARDAR